MMAGLEAGPLVVRNPRKLAKEQVLETLDSDVDFVKMSLDLALLQMWQKL